MKSYRRQHRLYLIKIVIERNVELNYRIQATHAPFSSKREYIFVSVIEPQV